MHFFWPYSGIVSPCSFILWLKSISLSLSQSFHTSFSRVSCISLLVPLHCRHMHKVGLCYLNSLPRVSKVPEDNLVILLLFVGRPFFYTSCTSPCEHSSGHTERILHCHYCNCVWSGAKSAAPSRNKWNVNTDLWVQR